MLIFGTQGRDEPRGVVADQCPRCERITRFVVVAHIEVGHVYFLPIGEGRHKHTTMQCLECRSDVVFRRDRYAEIMPMQFGRSCGIDELIARSNPRLAESLGLFREPAEATRPAAPERPPAPIRTTTCADCGYARARPFRFCPRCGTGAED